MSKLIISVGVVFFVALAGCETPPEETTPPVTRTVTLLWSGTIQGELHECDCPLVPGGLPRLATLIEQQRASIPDIGLLVDVGDVAGDPTDDEEVVVEPELARRVRAMLAYEALNEIGFDLYIPGERDLTLGARPIVELIEANGGEFLGTNVVSSSDTAPLGETVHWVETENGDVAVLGVVQPLDEGQSQAARRGHDEPVETLDAALALEMTLDTVIDRAVFIVLFAHGETQWARDLIADVDGVDVCVVAHEFEDPRNIEQINNTILQFTATEGKSLSRLEIVLEPDGSITFSGAPLAPDNDVEPDPDIQTVVDVLNDRLEAAQEDLNTANQGDSHPSGGVYRGFSYCGGCHSDQISSWYESDHVEAFQALQSIGWHVVPECFACHATGFGYDGGFTSRTLSPMLSGVACEACHGPSLNDPEDAPCPTGFGSVDESACLECHRSDRDPEFDFDRDVALIAH